MMVILSAFLIALIGLLVAGYLLKRKANVPLSIDADVWSIGIYLGDTLFNVADTPWVRNPVLSAADVTDIVAQYVADPFMVREGEIWNMFFEVMNVRTGHGEIGHATSRDGFRWHYERIVLREPFHMSYPYVFKFQDQYYMIPESWNAQSIRLYQATKFPTEWTYLQTLISGQSYVDSAVSFFNGYWWLFTTVERNLRLYHANDLFSKWEEHPRSPILINHPNVKPLNAIRSAGRIICFNGDLIRFTQDLVPYYGIQVRAFRIKKLTLEDYDEEEWRSFPY